MNINSATSYTTNLFSFEGNWEVLDKLVVAKEAELIERGLRNKKIIKTEKIACDNQYFLVVNRKIHLVYEGIKTALFKVKRACKRACTILPLRNSSPRAHRSCITRASNNKTSSKCSDSSASDPDGASLDYFHHISQSCVSNLPIATFDSASSTEVVK